MNAPDSSPTLLHAALGENASDLAIFKNLLHIGGVEAALKFLNGRTQFRYSAVYRLDGGTMRNVHVYDRKNESTSNLSEVPLGDSFCQFVMAENGFSTADSAADARLAGHTYQGVLNAYFGLPLSRAPGTIYGTFCHFDFEARRIDDPEIPFLEVAAPLLMDYLP